MQIQENKKAEVRIKTHATECMKDANRLTETLYGLLESQLAAYLRNNSLSIREAVEITPFISTCKKKGPWKLRVDFRVGVLNSHVCAILLGKGRRNASRLRTAFMPLRDEVGFFVCLSILNPNEYGEIKHERDIGEPDAL